jgi:uncharacterized RDD family membrane protein YckC
LHLNVGPAGFSVMTLMFRGCYAQRVRADPLVYGDYALRSYDPPQAAPGLFRRLVIMASSAQPGTGPTEEFRFPGSRLGLPEEGPGSVAGWGRRLLALLIDWLIAGLIASVVVGKPMWAGGNDYNTSHLAIFFLVTAILTGLAGGTIGHRICGLRVLNLKNKDVPQVGLLGGVIRSFLICLLIPAVIFDRDHRGLHDLAAKTVVVRR